MDARATMVSIHFITPQEMTLHLAGQFRAKRLSMNLSQKTLAARSGVSYAVIKKFETTGMISLKSLLKCALVLEAMDEFYSLFASKKHEEAISLDELIEDKSRKRGRK